MENFHTLAEIKRFLKYRRIAKQAQKELDQQRAEKRQQECAAESIKKQVGSTSPYRPV